MTKLPEIIAVEGRSAVGNGVSRPFRCLDTEGTEYYVKLKNVGFDHLVKEWVCGRLAQSMHLRCADIFQVVIPKELVNGDRELESELGHGIAFASKVVSPAVPLAREFVRLDSNGDLSGILIFDWWIKNSDRSLTNTGGNPNLLWKTDTGEVVMIDHDNAFDTDFDAAHFWKFHALRDQRLAWEPSRREHLRNWLLKGQSRLDFIWEELPETWLINDFGDPRVTLDKEGLRRVLSSPFEDPEKFWHLPDSK